jgi:histone-lysine N-methyltransferase SETMAR
MIFQTDSPNIFFSMSSDLAKIRDRAIVKHCYMMGLNRQECFEQLSTVYGKEGPSKPTVFAYYSALDFGKSMNEKLIEKVGDVVQKNPYLSLRKIADLVDSNKDSVRNILINVFDYKKRYCKWVPHTLTQYQKQVRVSVARKMLDTLKHAEISKFHNVLTGDESLFLYSYPFDSYWGKKGEPPLTIPKITIETSKLMVVVFWGVEGTPVLSFLPWGETMNAIRFCEIVVKPLAELAEKLPPEEVMKIHWDNASPHRARDTREFLTKSRLQLIPQPPYSPDLSPSDFFLFGFVKNQLRGKKCKNEESLLTEIGKIMDGISKERRIRVFQDWVWRLEAVIASGGEYY